MNHAGIQYGQPSMSSHQQHQQQQQQYNHPEITVAAGVSTTATLRQWRKREAEKPSIPENGSEAQGPIARVAPHAHYPRSSDIFTYPQYPEYGNLQYKEMSPTPVKYSEIVEPSGGHHLGHQAMPKSKELLEMCTMQQNQLKQYPHLQMMQNHYGLNQKESHQYLQKEQTGFPPYLPGYKLPNQYPRQYPNEFQIPLYNQDRLQEPSLYQNPGFLYQNRTMYRNYHRPQQVPQQYPNYNYKPNEPYRLHPYPQKFPQMPHIESVPGTISTRKMYQESLYRQNYNCNQLEYAQHYQNRMKVHQDYQETKLFPSPTQMPDVVPENSKSSLKQYLETWNDEPENPDDEKRTENLYIIDSTEIPTESIQQYIHLQVDKLPENIKGFISGSVIKDVGSSVIKTKGTSSPQISVISETKKFVDPKNQPEEQNTVIVYNNPEERKKEEEGFSILGQQLRKTPKPQNYQNEKPQENSTILVPDKFGIPRNTSKLTLEEIPPSCMQQNIPPKTVQRENIPRNISSPEGITSLSPQEISRLEPIEKYIDQNLKGGEIGDVPKPQESEKIVPKPDSEDKPRSLGLIEESVCKPEEDSCPENVIKSLDFAENPKIEDASRNKVVGENTKIAADFEEEFTQAIDLVIKSKEPKVPKFPDKFAEENKTEEEYCANGTKRKTSFGHIFGSLLGETKEDSKETLKQTVPSHPDCDLVCDLQHSKIMNPSIEEFNGALEELKVSLNCSSKVDVCGRSDEDLDEILIGTLDKTIENGDKGISADKNINICEDLEEIQVEDSVVDTTILGETSMDIDEMSVENEDSTVCDSEVKSVKIVEDNAMNLAELPVVNSEDVKIEDSNVNIAKMQDDIIKEFENNEEFEDSNLRKFGDTEDICNEIVKEEEVEEKVDCDEISIEIDEEKVTKFEPTQEPSIIEESVDGLLKEEKKCVNEENLPEEVDCENQEVIETKTEEVFIEESPEIKTEETSFEETTIKDEVSLKCEEINISKMEEEDSPSRKSEDSLNEDIQMNEETKPLNLFEEFSLVEKKSEIDDSAQIELKSSQDFEENEVSGCEQVEIKEESLKFEEITGEISKDSSKKLMEELEENKDKGARTEIDNVEELFAQVIEENVQNSNLIEESSSKEDHLHEETPVVKQTEVEDNPKSLLLDAASQTCPNLSKPVQNISVQTLFATQEVATSTEDFLQIPTVIPEPPPVPKNFDHKFIQTVLTLEDKPTQTTNSNASKSIQTLTDISTKTTQTEDPKPTDFTNLTTEENRILLQIAGELLEINVITTQGKKFISIVPYTDCTIISETNNNIIEDPSREEPEEFAFGPAEEVVFEEQVNEIEIGIEEEIVCKNEEVKSESEEVVSRNEDEVVKTEAKEEIGVGEIGEKVVEEIAEEEESLQGFDSLEKNGDGIEDSKTLVEEIEKKSIVMEEFKVTVTGVSAESLLETNKFEAEKIEERIENSHVNEEEVKQLHEMKIEDIVCKETEGIEKMEEHIFEDKGVEMKKVGMEVNTVSSEIEEPKMVKETSMENIAEEIRKIREEIDSVKKSSEVVEERKVEGDKKEEKRCKESARNDGNKKNGNIVKTVVDDKKKIVSKSSDKKRERNTKTIAKKSEDVSRKRFKKTEDSVKETSSISMKVSVKENISTLESSKAKFVSTKHNFSIIPKRDSPIKKFPNTNKKLASLAQLSPPQTNPPPPKVKTKAELKETPRIIPTQKLQKQVKKIAPMPSPKPLPKKKRLSLEEYKRKRTNSDRSPGKSPKKINIDHDAEIFSKKEFEEPQWQTLSLNESWDKLDKHFGLPPIRKQTTDPGFGTNVESLMEMKVEIDQFCERNKRNVDPRRKTEDVVAIKSKIVEKAEAVVKVEDVENKSIPSVCVIKENSTAKPKEETVSKERYTEDSHRQECDAWAKKISSSIEDIFTQTFRKDKQRPAYKKLNFDLDSLNPLRPQTIQSTHPKKMQNLIDLNELLPTVKQVKTEETNENSSMDFRKVESKFRGGWEKEDVKVNPLEGRVSVIRESGPKFGEEFKKVVGEERKKDACKKLQRHRRSTVSSEELREAKLPDHQGESVKNQEKLVGNSDFVIEGNPRCSTAFSREVGDGKPAVHRGESLENQKYFSTKKPSEVPMKNVDVKSGTVEETLITKENSSRRKGEEIGKNKNQEVQGSDPKDEGVATTVRTNEEVKNSAISNIPNEEVGGNIKASEGRSTMLRNEEFKGSVQNTDVGCCRMLSNEGVEGSVKTSDLRSCKTLSAEVEGCVRTNEVSYGMLAKEEVEDVVKTIAVGGCRMLSIEEVKGGEVGSLLVNKEVKTNEVRRYRRGSRSGLKKGSSVESLEGFEVKDLPRLVRFKEGDRRCEVVEEMPVLSPQNVIKISRRLSIDDISKKLMDSKTEASYVRCNSEDLKLHLKKVPEAENLKLHIKLSPKTSGGKVEGVEKKVSKKSTKRSRKRFRNLHADEEIEGYSVFETQNQTGLPKLIIKRNTCENRENGLQPFVRIQRDPDLDILAKKKKKYF